MPSLSNLNEETFDEAEKFWNLSQLYADLARAKGKELTPTQKKYLRGLLCGFSPVDIAEKTVTTSKSVSVTLAREIYPAIKQICGKEKDEKLNWGSVRPLLEEKGYKREVSAIELLWQRLKSRGSETDKMGPVLLGAQPQTLDFHEPSPNNSKKITIPAGSEIRFQVTLDRPGNLLLLEKGTSGKFWCLCPSYYAPIAPFPAGVAVLPQPETQYKCFKLSKHTGVEELVAAIAPQAPNFPWLPKPDGEPLQLQEGHLRDLLAFLEGDGDAEVLYMDFEVV